MNNNFLLLIALLTLSSCARIFNNANHRINVNTSKNVMQVDVNGKTLTLKNNTASVDVYRDTIPLNVVVQTKDSAHHLTFKNKNSFNYIAGGIWTWGIDWLIEKKDQKRYFYQKNIYLEAVENKINVYRFEPDRKGKLFIDFSIPYLNNIYLKTPKGHQQSFGFWGLSTGLDYFYKQNISLSLVGGVAIDYEVPVLVGVDHDPRDTILRLHTSFISLMNNHSIRSFSFGYGLNISKYKWSLSQNSGISATAEKIINRALGLSFAANYRISNLFRTGVLYQPSVLEFKNGLHTGYQHLISLQLQWKLSLN